MGDESKVIGEFAKNSKDIVRVQLRKYDGTDLLDIRIWYKAEDGTLRPSRKGVSVRTSQAFDLFELVVGAMREISGTDAQNGRSERPMEVVEKEMQELLNEVWNDIQDS